MAVGETDGVLLPALVTLEFALAVFVDLSLSLPIIPHKPQAPTIATTAAKAIQRAFVLPVCAGRPEEGCGGDGADSGEPHRKQNAASFGFEVLHL